MYYLLLDLKSVHRPHRLRVGKFFFPFHTQPIVVFKIHPHDIALESRNLMTSDAIDGASSVHSLTKDTGPSLESVDLISHMESLLFETMGPLSLTCTWFLVLS